MESGSFSGGLEYFHSLRTMKVLALHGIGSSSALLKKQLAPLIVLLGPDYDFIFFDGGVCCGKGPGMHISLNK